MIETLINNIRWRLIEWLSKPEYIHLDINHFYCSIDRLKSVGSTKYIGEVRYL